MAATPAVAAVHPAAHSAAYLYSHPHIILTARTQPREYVVRGGDTLSVIARRELGSPKKWPLIWAANRKRVPNPNLILRGARLRIPGNGPVTAHLTAMAYRAIPKPPPPPSPQQASAPVAQAAPVAVSAAPAAAPVAQASYSSGSGFQACVIARESGGNPNAWNPNGHYGLYQFSAGTWAANGGNPADFGNASVAEQNQVFATTMASGGGASNWAPYDGC